MLNRYKEIFFGFLLGLAMWMADSLMHTMMPASPSEEHTGLAEELFSTDHPQLIFRLFFVTFALFLGWLLWRSNWGERKARDPESREVVFFERIITLATLILDDCTALARGGGLTGESLKLVEEIHRHAMQADDFARGFLPRTLASGGNADARQRSDLPESRPLPTLKELLRWLPGFVALSEYVDVFMGIVYEGWGDRGRRFDRAHDRVWDYEEPIEQKRYTLILDAVSAYRGRNDWGEVLEVGCAQGIFTEQLAVRCQSLTASDISPLACVRATRRCATMTHVRIVQNDITQEDIAEEFDVVFALDLFEALHGRQRIERVVNKLIGAMRPGSLLVVSSSRLPERMRDSWWAQRMIEGADNHLAHIQTRADVRLTHREFYPAAEGEIPGYPQHLVAIFQKVDRGDQALDMRVRGRLDAQFLHRFSSSVTNQ
jgi:SAM-dependent methyltransferase